MISAASMRVVLKEGVALFFRYSCLTTLKMVHS